MALRDASSAAAVVALEGKLVRLSVATQGFAGEASQPLGRITVSGGVATFPLDAQDDIGLVKAADVRLYQAKEKGRDCTVGAGGRRSLFGAPHPEDASRIDSARNATNAPMRDPSPIRQS